MNTSAENSFQTIPPLLRYITDNKYRWLRHSIFLLICLVLAFKGDLGQKEKMDVAAWRNILIMDGLMYIFIMTVLYVLLLVLIPRLLFRSKLLLFFLCYLVIATLVYIVSYTLESTFLKPVLPAALAYDYQFSDFSFNDFVAKALVVAVMLGCVTGLKIFKKWIIDMQRMNELQQANLKTELEQLKSQVNPHFLFNTLNNLHVLTKTDPEKASQVILGLSDLLRYQLYDSAKEQILLSKDIAFIYNLLTMEKLRKDDFTYEVHSEGKIDGISLPPFLFIPFVENAIKHGAAATGHSYLKLNFRITPEHLYFYSENSKPVSRKSSVGGIGLKNIKRRLELLYPGKHTLEIKEDAEKYIVNLTLPL